MLHISICDDERIIVDMIQKIPICAKTGEGIEEWAQWLKNEIEDWKK